MILEYLTEKQNILADVIATHGVEKQSDQLQEECEELISAVNLRRHEKISDLGLLYKIVDVMVTCEQLAMTYLPNTFDMILEEKLEKIHSQLKKHKKDPQ